MERLGLSRCEFAFCVHESLFSCGILMGDGLMSMFGFGRIALVFFRVVLDMRDG